MKNKYLIISSVALFTILVIFVLFNSFSNKSSRSELNKVENKVVIEQVEPSLTGDTLEEDKTNSINAAKEILELTNLKIKDQEELKEVLIDMENNGITNVDLEKLNQLIVLDDYDEATVLNIVQGLVAISYTIYHYEGDINVVGSDTFVKVYQEFGMSFVPIDIFTTEGNAFNMLMKYDGEKWVLIPYPLIEQIRILSLV